MYVDGIVGFKAAHGVPPGEQKMEDFLGHKVSAVLCACNESDQRRFPFKISHQVTAVRSCGICPEKHLFNQNSESSFEKRERRQKPRFVRFTDAILVSLRLFCLLMQSDIS